MQKPLGLYIHIPFCIGKCFYCAFNSYPEQSQEVITRYVEALKREIAQAGYFSNEISTIFVGGGTPTCLSGETLKDIIQACFRHDHVMADVEITVECNPGTVDKEKLMVMREAGVNRLSFGVQDLHDSFLKTIGRIHTVESVWESYHMAREVGYRNINMDLMFGLPGQTLGDFKETLQRAVDLNPEHFSVYGLKVEPGTCLSQWEEQGKVFLPSQDEQADMFEYAIKFLTDEGYEHYEISNFAKPGYKCKHNQIYWRNEEYIGFGAGAWSYFQGVRRENIKDPNAYIGSVEQEKIPVEYQEEIDLHTQISETMIMHLRMNCGISGRYFQNRFGIDIETVYGKTLADLKAWGLLEEAEDCWHLTSKGILLGNNIFEKFLL